MSLFRNTFKAFSGFLWPRKSSEGGFFLTKNPLGIQGFDLHQAGKCYSRWVAGFVVLTGLLLSAPVRSTFAADDLASVLSKLDSASLTFKSAQADVNWDNVQIAPIEETDKQVGTAIFERKNGQLRMALRIKTYNGKPVPKDMVYANSVFKLYEPLQKQIQVFKAGSNTAKINSMLTLGFGGSGKDLQKSWNVTYAGTEQVDGKPAAKLELVPRDESMKNNFPRLLLWVDMENGIALKQQRFDTSGNYNVVSYHNIRLNGPVPSDAFEIKTASGTNVVNR
jgi:outer membrane lipoprotein-sorting protein